MNRTLFAVCMVLAATLLALTFAKGQPVSVAAGPQGRFALYNMEYTAISDSVSIKEKGVFRIDTQTGETVQYLAGQAEGKLIHKWVIINER